MRKWGDVVTSHAKTMIVATHSAECRSGGLTPCGSLFGRVRRLCVAPTPL